MSGSGQYADKAMPSPGHRRSVGSMIIERLVHQVVRDQLGRVHREALDVLDAGGGTGSVAVPLAAAGHRVTVVDPSPDSLAALEQRAVEADVKDRVRAIQGDASELLDVVPQGGFDLVLCHNVLEVVDDPATALGAMAAATRPAGALSLLAANRHAVIWAKALAGHLRAAHAALTGGDEPSATFAPSELEVLLAHAGYVPVETHGVRVFADLLPSVDRAHSHIHDGTDALLELELAASEHPTFRGLGAHLHILARLHDGG